MPEKSGASPSSLSSGLPKSNTTSLASLSLSLAENGRPILLRKPSSGPTSRCSISVSASCGSIWRPPMIFQNAKSHDGFMHWNFLYFSCTSPPHFGHGLRERGEIAGDRVALVVLGLADDVLGHLHDLVHEDGTRELAVLHLRELELPLGGELGREELRDAEPVQQRHQRERLRGGRELLALAMDVALADEAFDDRRARGRRAEALLAHRLAKLVVLDGLARAFHRRQQRALVVARRRPRDERVDVDLLGVHLLVRLHRARARTSSPCASLPYTASHPGVTSTLPSVLNGSPSTRVMRVVTRCSAAG